MVTDGRSGGNLTHFWLELRKWVNDKLQSRDPLDMRNEYPAPLDWRFGRPFSRSRHCSKGVYSATVQNLAPIFKPISCSLFCPSRLLRTKHVLNPVKDCIRNDKDRNDSLLVGHFYCIKAKVHHITGHEGTEREYSSTLSLTSALDAGGRSTPLYSPGKGTGTRFTGGWVGPRAGLDGCGNVAPNGIRSPDHPARKECL
jgi:hypothetical protein